MRTLAAVTLTALLAAPSLAHAGRWTLGAALGRTHAEVDADAELDASSTTGLWVRANLGSRFGVDLEFAKISTEDDATLVRSVNLVGRMTVVPLRGGTLRPMVLVGLGSEFVDDGDFNHSELGFAVELDVAKDFVLGGDFRFGDRQRDEDLVAQPARDDVTFLQPSVLAEGGYRAGRIYLGVRL